MPFSITLTSEDSDKDQLVKVKQVLESIQGSYLEYTQNEEVDFIPAPQQKGSLSEENFFDWMS